MIGFREEIFRLSQEQITTFLNGVYVCTCVSFKHMYTVPALIHAHGVYKHMHNQRQTKTAT